MVCYEEVAFRVFLRIHVIKYHKSEAFPGFNQRKSEILLRRNKIRESRHESKFHSHEKFHEFGGKYCPKLGKETKTLNTIVGVKFYNIYFGKHWNILPVGTFWCFRNKISTWQPCCLCNLANEPGTSQPYRWAAWEVHRQTSCQKSCLVSSERLIEIDNTHRMF